MKKNHFRFKINLGLKLLTELIEMELEELANDSEANLQEIRGIDFLKN